MALTASLQKCLGVAGIEVQHLDDLNKAHTVSIKLNSLLKGLCI